MAKEMKINKDPKKTLQFNPDKCNNLYNDLLEAFQKHKPTVGEILVALGNLTYTIGASIEGFEDKGPDFEKAKELYYKNPEKIGLALIMQGFFILSWYESYQEQLTKK